MKYYKEFWIEKAPDDKTYKLELLAESNRFSIDRIRFIATWI